MGLGLLAKLRYPSAYISSTAYCLVLIVSSVILMIGK
jgi:hypothetical protein